VWMNGILVGMWSVDRGAHTFRYDESWLVSPHRRSLSLSLPISSSLEIKGDAVKNYFDNLLPDNDKIRLRLAKRFNAKSDTFGLLEAIGRDCVGAVQLLPEDVLLDGRNRIDCEPLSNEKIADILKAVPADASPAHNDSELFRISIAGAQEKTAFTLWNGQWCHPRGSTPTTHIFKLPLGFVPLSGALLDMSNSVQNEWLCAQIVAAFGLQTATTSMLTFGEQTVLVVERFDREWRDDDSWIARLPQEDFCQALAVSPEKKYEQHGGPGMLQCLQLLQGSLDKGDATRFLLTQLVFFLLAASDGHAKNFSIFLRHEDAYEMTPLYDILSVWPYLGNGAHQLSPQKAGAAMAIRSKSAHYRFRDMHTRHWHQLAMKNGGPLVWRAMVMLVLSVDEVLAKVALQLPINFQEHTWISIAEGMRIEAKRFLSGITKEQLPDSQ
jgi:serine/threonine-protein kinase HipA